MNMEREPVLIIGGAGYIGSHTAKYLYQKGYNPIVYDDLSTGYFQAVKWGELIIGSIGDMERIEGVLKEKKPIAVIHFAAYAYVGESVTNPQKYYNNNVLNTIVLLNAMIKHNINKIIFSSTCAIYGEPENLPITEEESKKPINPYGRSKWMIEQILKDYETGHGIKSVCLRYFNASGADSDAEIGETHDPETHLIPLILDVATGKRESIKVFGNDYLTKDGTCIRDYIHVTDLAQAHHQGLEYLKEGNESTQLNLGNGTGFSVNEVIEMVKKVTNKPIKVEYNDRRTGDPTTLVGSSDKAKKVLGWNPEYYELEEIIKTAWKWHIKQ